MTEAAKQMTFRALRARLASQALLIESLTKALEPFAKDADNWSDAVPDDYQPRCTEPGKEYAHPGSETAFTVGDLRRAVTALASAQRAKEQL